MLKWFRSKCVGAQFECVCSVCVTGADRRLLEAAYLHSGFSQIDFECQLFSGVDVRVVRFSKNPLQLLQLGTGEGGPDASLLPLLVQSAVIREELVGNCKRNKVSPCEHARHVRVCNLDVVK